MTALPRLKTDRLLLRPFRLADAPRVQRLAGDRAVAATTLNIPHPYEDGMAEAWIRTHRERFQNRGSVTLAITLIPGKQRVQGDALNSFAHAGKAGGGPLIGAIGLTLAMPHARGELGYWIGKPYWGKGYCTEAGRAILRYGFETFELLRIFARYMTSNPASGRVLEKLGLQFEGCLRQHVNKWGRYEDLNFYAILRSDYLRQQGAG